MRAEFDDAGSPVPSSMLTSVKTLDLQAEKACMIAKKYRVQDFHGNEIPENTSGCPLLGRQAQKAILNIASKEIQMFPVTIACQDGDIADEYMAVRPLIKRPCVDLEKSDVDWIDDLEAFFRWEKLIYLEGCMGDAAIVREAYSRKTVVTDKLRSVMLPFVGSPSTFCPPSEYLMD